MRSKLTNMTRPAWLNYGLAVLITALALVLTFTLRELLEGTLLLFFIPAILLAAWLGGRGPGIAAALLSTAALNYFFTPPLYSFGVASVVDVLQLATFLLVAIVTAALTDAERRHAAQVHAERERLQVTLTSIGDAVITTDNQGRVEFMNPVAQDLTGWSQAQAAGQPVEAVFRIVSEADGSPVESPVARVLREGQVVGLANHTVLIQRLGQRVPIDDSGAPIRSRDGQVLGAVMVFRDIGERRRVERAQAILAEAGQLLATALNLETTLQTVARLAVPAFADWCRVDSLTGTGELDQWTVACVDPELSEKLREVQRRYPPRAGQPHPLLERLRAGQPIFVPVVDEAILQAMAEDDEHLALLQGLGMRALIVQPLSAHGRLLGAATFVVSGEQRGYAEPDLALSQELAWRGAMALDSARHYREARDAEAQARAQAERLTVLAEAGHRLLRAGGSVGGVLEALACEAAVRLGDAGGVRLLGDDRQWLTAAASYHRDQDARRLLAEAGSAAIPSDEGLYVPVLASGQALLMPEVSPAMFAGQPGWPTDYLDQFGVSSFLAVPVRGQQGVVGLLVLARDAGRPPYDEGDLLLAQQLADRAGLLIENARLYEAAEAARREAEQAAERTAQLQSITAALSQALTPDDIMAAVVERGAASLRWTTWVLMLTSADGEELVMAQAGGLPPQVAEEFRRVPLSAAIPVADVARTGEPLWIESNESLLERYPHLAHVRTITENHALAVVPLVVEDRVLGSLSVSLAHVYQFTADDRGLLLTLAQQCAQALERARLYESERKARRQAEAARQDVQFLAGAGAALARTLDYAATVQTIAEQAVLYLADWCVVDTFSDEGRLQLTGAAHIDPARTPLIRELRRHYPPEADNAIWQVARTGQPELAPEIDFQGLLRRARDERQRELLSELGIASHLVVPINVHGRLVGVLSLVRGPAREPYRADHVPLAEELAWWAGMALDNARLFTEAQALNAELEERVRQRTAELEVAIEELRIANEDLENEVVQRRRTEERFRRLLEAAPDATVIVDEAGQIVLVNPQVERLFGYSPAELLGQPVELLMDERYTARHRLHRAHYNRNPRRRPMGAGLQLLARHKSGREFPVEISLGPLQTDEGILISCVIRDITERQRAEDELRESHAQLRALMSRVHTVREEERGRIAREVHDELGGTLTGLKMDVSRLRRTLEAEDQASALEGTEEVLSAIDAAVQTVRRIATDLRPAILDDFGLRAAIEWQLNEFQERSGLQCQFDSDLDDAPLRGEAATAIFRVFQETLTNVARHAQATQVTVSLRREPKQLILSVSDNGRGIRPAEVIGERSLGLLGMRERVRLLDGELDINGEPGKGTTVQVKVPLKTGT